ncbi:MAG: ECF transporter S component, partial [Clostridia bacterium]|nr:ECF transporter S component [Clostridia bacterium]
MDKAMKTTTSTRLLKITTTAVMIAFTCVLTMAVRIPSPTKGYLNLGDAAVLLSGWLLGPIYGSIAGGVGSALADLFAGYPVYVPGTLITKAAMALFVSLIPRLFSRAGHDRPRLGFMIGATVAEIT